MPKSETLAYIASVGAGLVIGSGLIYQYAFDRKLRSSIFYQESMDLVTNNSIIKNELGVPIVHCFKKNFGKFSGEDDYGNWIVIPLKGSKSTGDLKYWVKQTDSNVLLNRVEVTFDHISNRKLLISSNTNKLSQN